MTPDTFAQIELPEVVDPDARKLLLRVTFKHEKISTVVEPDELPQFQGKQNFKEASKGGQTSGNLWEGNAASGSKCINCASGKEIQQELENATV